MPVLGALSPFLEPFCGHLSPKLDKVSEKLTFEILPQRASGGSLAPVFIMIYFSLALSLSVSLSLHLVPFLSMSLSLSFPPSLSLSLVSLFLPLRFRLRSRARAPYFVQAVIKTVHLSYLPGTSRERPLIFLLLIDNDHLSSWYWSAACLYLPGRIETVPLSSWYQSRASTDLPAAH